MAVTLVIAAGVASKAAYADPIGELFANLTGQARAAYENHLETDTVTPAGTTINLFDYWDTEKTPDGGDLANSDPDGGINFDNQLKFTTGYGPYQDTENINQYTSSEAPRAGMLVSTLQSGYPALSGTSGLSWKGTDGNTGSPVLVTQESLAYLFDESEQSGKDAYLNVAGLLQVDEDGYYYYNSQENYAAYDEASNSFDVYDTPGVTQREFSSNGSITSSVQGMFFPFNSANDVFNEEGGELVEKEGVVSQNGNYWSGPRDTSLNHYFGLTMTTKFVQTTGGMTTHGNQPVTYEFSGDDDVWVFIDGVLVGDLGGIHDAASLKIDFSTGNIYINGALDGTLKDKITSAGVETAAEEWNGNTFADGTYHTLKFFYLERGNVASNMNLKFNLVSVPDSEVVKVDQQGEYLSGAGFELYATDENYTASGEPVASGTTGADGRLTLVDSMGALITFEDLVKTTKMTHFVLRENVTLEGYRKTDDIHIAYQDGAVYCTNHWETGAFANANELITSSSLMKTTGGAILNIDENGVLQSSDSSVGDGGKLYAMVLHREPDTGSGNLADSSWRAVYGDVINGELGLTDPMAGDNYAATVKYMLEEHPDNVYELKPNAIGLYSVQIDALPGDIQKYYYALGDNEKDKTEYAIAFYYVADDVVHRIADENIGGSYAFSRQFGATFHVPNIKNRISVQKIDDAGNTVTDAVFALYRASDVTVNDDGTVTVNSGAKPFETQKTEDLTKAKDGIDLKGGAVFEGEDAEDGDGVLPTGEYYLVEVVAPEGYEMNNRATKVVVNADGVYADAGVANDGITVNRGVGTLVSTMKQFGVNDSIDSTLHDVKVTLQSGSDPSAGNANWVSAGKGEVHYKYSPTKDSVIEYALDEGQDANNLSTDEGWSNLEIKQCLAEHGGDLPKQNLSDQSLNALFSGSVNVVVSNQRTGDLQIQKTVEGYEGISDEKLLELQSKEFNFTITLKSGDEALSGTYDVEIKDAKGDTAKKTLTFNEKGEAQVVLKDKEILTINDLSIGTSYTVQEIFDESDTYKDLFDTTVTCDSDNQVTLDNNNRTASGVIRDINDAVSGLETVLVSFNNKYAPIPTESEKIISAQKILTGRDWNKTDAFTFKLVESETNPVSILPEGGLTYTLNAPENTLGSKNQPQEFVFNTESDKLIFTEPGEYEFSLSEEQPGAGTALSSVSYSQAEYLFKYTVEDVDGQLEVTQESVTKLKNDDSIENGSELGENEVPSFTNAYSATGELTGENLINVSKTLIGRDWMDDETYEFKLEALTENAPMPADGGATLAIGRPSDGGATNTGSFGTITFDQTHAGGEFAYKVTEVTSSGDSNMAYSKAEYQVAIVVIDNGDGTITPSIKDISKLKHDSGDDADEVMTPQICVFTNTYDAPEPVKDVKDNNGNSINDQMVGVGDELTYTINWSNDAIDSEGKATVADVITITDKVPTGTEFVSADNGGVNTDGTVTWTIENAAANATGTVSFKVKVTEDAVQNLENTITNNASITVGENDPKVTNETKNYVPEKIVKNGEADVDNGTIQVGQMLTYQISYRNGGQGNATVVVTDKVPSGTTFFEASDDSNGQVSADADGNLTWTMNDVPAGESGFVTFTVKVDESALAIDAITNQATIEIGDRESKTNTTETKVQTGTLEVSKNVVNGDANKSFDFTVGFKDSAGNALAGTYKIGDANVTLSAGTDVWAGYGIATLKLTHGQSITIDGLPAGATYKVIETKTSGYTTTINGGTEVDFVDEGAISVDSPATVAYTNTYATTPGGAQADTDALFTKSISGRDWQEGDEFTFTLTPNEGAPLRDEQGTVQTSRTATASYENVEDGKVKFGFGKLYYTLEDLAGADYDSATGKRAKTFTYNVTENDTDIAGITKDDHTATITVTLTDDGAGNLTAAAVVAAANADFVNTYSTGVDYDAMGVMQISKKLTGRDMTKGQFEWTVVPTGGNAAETVQKFGIPETGTVVKSSAATNGATVTMPVEFGSDVKFTNEDANKVYTFQVSETKKGGAGYTNDDSVYTVKVAPTFDVATGVLTVTTTVENAAGEVIETKVTTSDKTQIGGKVTVPFANSYDAGSVTLGGEGDVKINATKTLTNRPMVDDEFSFVVTNTANTDPDAEPVTTGKSKADGSIVFEKIEYTTASLEADLKNGLATRTINADRAYTYTYQYLVSEEKVTTAGVDAVTQPQTIIVTVTDAHDGTPLTVGVTYPDGASGITFKNTYGVDAQDEVDIAGIKVLGYSPQELAADAKLTQADIAGKYTFKISGVDEDGNAAPMPTKDGAVVSEATNDAAGNVVFGKVSFTMESVFGDTGDAQTRGTVRTKTFTYTVTESGDLPGVANDSDAKTGKTFTVTVTDDGNGGLSAETSAAAPAPLFQFTNTYSITTPEPSSVTDQITITKKLDGREMVGGEFNFELVEMVDGKETVVAKGSNAVDGTVTFEAITYSAPGEHNYLVREVNDGKGGVTYDTKNYSIHTSVTDDGDGTLSVKHELIDAQEAIFTNTYEADPATVNLGAAKLLNNAKPGDARFTFQVLDKDGKVVAEAQNDEDGAVKFPALTFDAAGEYDYTIVEVNDGQEGVTYDESRIAVKVVVSATDPNGSYTGQLYPSVEYANGISLFSNTYTEPEDPSEPGGGKPDGPEPPALPDTSDNFGPLVMGLGVLAVMACAGLAVAAIKMRRKPGSHRMK